MDCQEVFKEAAAHRDRCGYISKIKPGCSCEGERVSHHSPGLVADGEIIARLIYSPLHVDLETGETKEAAFSDVTDKGLSIQRLSQTSSAEVRAIGEKKLADDHAKGRTDREFLGMVTAEVKQVRQQTYEDGQRAFCVYDSGLPDAPAHADVCQMKATPSAMKRARKKLCDLFERKPRIP